MTFHNHIDNISNSSFKYLSGLNEVFVRVLLRKGRIIPTND